MRASESVGYSGPDRRKPVPLPNIRPQLIRLLLATAVVFAVWCILASFAWTQDAQVRDGVVELSRAVAGALLLAASALRLSIWRITGLARAAWTSVAFAVAGIAFPVIGMIDLVQRLTGPGDQTAALTRALVELALLGIATAALRSPEVHSRLRPLRLVAVMVAGCLVIAAAFALHGVAAGPSPWLTIAASASRWTTAALWSALALAFALVGWRRHRASDFRIGLALGMLAVAELIRAGVDDWEHSRLLIPSGVQVCAAFLVAGMSALRLWQAQSGRGTRFLKTVSLLHGARSDLADTEREQAERLHDARSAILSIAGAAHLMADPQQAARIDRGRLHLLVAQELDRLATILDPQYRTCNRPFRPVDVVEPLVLAHRLSGADIELDATDVYATGSADATATAVANLLCNARKYAPGGRIWVTISGGADVTISVADDGPGIGEREMPLVLHEGVRGSAAAGAGTGFGIPSAARLMADQGGTLRLGRRVGGGLQVVLTLPQAPSPDESPSVSAPAPSSAVPVANLPTGLPQPSYAGTLGAAHP